MLKLSYHDMNQKYKTDQTTQIYFLQDWTKKYNQKFNQLFNFPLQTQKLHLAHILVIS